MKAPANAPTIAARTRLIAIVEYATPKPLKCSKKKRMTATRVTIAAMAVALLARSGDSVGRLMFYSC